MKVLVFGNHACANRGDSAILRGLLAELELLLPGAQYEIRSRYPTASGELLGREVSDDPFYRWHKNVAANYPKRISRLALWAIPLLMALAINTGWKLPLWLLPKSLRREIGSIGEFDLAIQVGGSFFVDLYGPGQFEAAYAAILSRVPLVLAGHSMGPFGGAAYQWLAATLLSHADAIDLREQASRQLIESNDLPVEKLIDGADTAWLVPPSTDPSPIGRKVQENAHGRPLIGITVRDLSIFAPRLGVTQQGYEMAFSRLAERLIAQGYSIVAIPTCTSIGGYHADDRLVAARIEKSLSSSEHFHAVTEDLDDVQTGQLFASCNLVFSTRLHGAIIAMNFGVPAIALDYEHKSMGVMQRFGDRSLSKAISSLFDGQALSAINRMASDPRTRDAIQVAVANERALARVALAMAVGAATARPS